MIDTNKIIQDSLPQIIGGLIVVALLAIFSTFRQKIKAFFRFKKSLSYRESIGSSNNEDPSITEEGIKAKLDMLHNLTACPIALLGSVYLDIALSPINTTTLAVHEWSNIDPLRFSIGGSTLWVGRYLYAGYNKKSYVFSIRGGPDDPLKELFDKQLQNEPWLLNKLIIGPPNSRTAVTVHLVQSKNKFTTMFTHRGVLSKFDWSDIEAQLNEELFKGGVLYISGFLKTNLWMGLRDNLQKLSAKTLICIEHGGIIRDLDNPQAIQALSEVFEQRLIDVYICTYSEIWNFCHFGLNMDCTATDGDVQSKLEEIAALRTLPYITFVRDNDIPGNNKVFVIIGKSVYPLESSSSDPLISSSVGPKNAFNAAILYNLSHNKKQESLRDEVIAAGKNALKMWQQQR